MSDQGELPMGDQSKSRHNSEGPLPDFTLDELRHRMKVLDVKRLLIKELAPNDNSKNQPYLSGSMDVANILPSGTAYVDVTPKGNRVMKAPLPLEWLQPDGESVPAPDAKLILYPQYPEVRFSGFLNRARNAPSHLLTTRMPGRILFFGITRDRRIIGWCVGPDSKIAREIASLGELETEGVFRIIPLEARKASTRDILFRELRRIHELDWIVSKALRQDGSIVPCRSSNCIGYTLEAELGVARNGLAEPDFEGWEVKANQVGNFTRPPPPGKAITLMTPEPTGGFYRKAGVEDFIRTYGYEDKMGRKDRLNFGGVHRVGVRHDSTHLTLVLDGYDLANGQITNPEGSLNLLDDRGEVAAAWSFTGLLNIWNRKHAKAVYVPGEVRTDAERSYRYGATVRIGEGTSFNHLVRALAKGDVYYDPGIKLENASSAKPGIKRRSQFRIKSGDMEDLYDRFEVVSSFTDA
ncbi:MvaI/BcnI family restriction endonuclease [uncultured Sneathiella sp.]|uniref:MvaI/BcnI family restriction endonuclease n=1 Tax=uncultured Sneathiella sp. TaxID=879315 RepID=UPI0030D9F5E5